MRGEKEKSSEKEMGTGGEKSNGVGETGNSTMAFTKEDLATNVPGGYGGARQALEAKRANPGNHKRASGGGGQSGDQPEGAGEWDLCVSDKTRASSKENVQLLLLPC